ncbi:ChaN family lipoprotein [Kaarinaea lacus]
MTTYYYFIPSLVTRLIIPALILLIVNTAACSTNQNKPVNQNVPFELTQKDHPLVGKIWDVEQEQYVSKEQLLDKVLSSDYVMLGETHDNIKHHEDHGWIISELSNKKPRTVVAFEMVNEEQASTINSSDNLTTDKALDILEQAKTGWEYKKYYGPVFGSVVQANLKIYPADLDRPTMMKVVREGQENAPDELQSLLQNNQLSDEDREALRKEIEATHCGMINEDMTKAMMLGQRVRDAAIGNSLYRAKTSDIQAVVLVSGSGHIRKDRGAPMYLSAQDKTASILSIAWLEVAEDVKDPKEYATPWGRETMPFDFVVFTPAADRPDPCEEMKKFMHHKKNNNKKTDE